MKIEYFHASKFGNGAMVAEEFKQQMTAKGVNVAVHHIREMKRQDLASADLYVFRSPGRMGKPLRSVRRFLERLSLPAGTKYALLTTEAAPKPDRKEPDESRPKKSWPAINESPDPQRDPPVPRASSRSPKRRSWSPG